MKISVEEVEHIANMARLYMDKKDIAPVAEQLNRIIDYIDILEEADVTGVAPCFSPSSMENVLREDETTASSTVDAFANAPEQADNFYLVPRVVKS